MCCAGGLGDGAQPDREVGGARADGQGAGAGPRGGGGGGWAGACRGLPRPACSRALPLRFAGYCRRRERAASLHKPRSLGAFAFTLRHGPLRRINASRRTSGYCSRSDLSFALQRLHTPNHQAFADRVAAIFVPAVLACASLTFGAWWAAGGLHAFPDAWLTEGHSPFLFALLFGIAVVVRAGLLGGSGAVVKDKGFVQALGLLWTYRHRHGECQPVNPLLGPSPAGHRVPLRTRPGNPHSRHGGHGRGGADGHPDQGGC